MIARAFAPVTAPPDKALQSLGFHVGNDLGKDPPAAFEHAEHRLFSGATTLLPGRRHAADPRRTEIAFVAFDGADKPL